MFLRRQQWKYDMIAEARLVKRCFQQYPTALAPNFSRPGLGRVFVSVFVAASIVLGTSLPSV